MLNAHTSEFSSTENHKNIVGNDFITDVDLRINYFDIPENFSDIIVVWSGGCDSTALVLYLWEKFHKKINLVSIDYDRFGSYNTDLKSRKKLLKIFKEREIDITYQEITIRENFIYDDYVNIGGISQPQMFLSALANLIRGENKLICFGYIKNDDIWHFINDFVNLFKNINKLANAKAHLYMPFEWITKDKILWYLHEHRLLNICGYCQYPSETGKACSTCESCETHKNAIKKCKKVKWKYNELY